ncbi:MAG: spermine synthase, partial [Thermoleophilia bacterium]|nr:spermine synthase [Thermoleophilia bacterium]
LEPGGVAAANLIGAVEGPRSELLRSMRRTWADVFDDVVLYPVPNADGALDLRAFSNIELFAARKRGVLPSRGGEGPLFEAAHLSGTGDVALDDPLRALIADRYAGVPSSTGVPILTDDLAPVDSLMQVDGI